MLQQNFRQSRVTVIQTTILLQELAWIKYQDFMAQQIKDFAARVSGGYNKSQYMHKYLKYKSKYLNLRYPQTTG